MPRSWVQCRAQPAGTGRRQRAPRAVGREVLGSYCTGSTVPVEQRPERGQLSSQAAADRVVAQTATGLWARELS